MREFHQESVDAEKVARQIAQIRKAGRRGSPGRKVGVGDNHIGHTTVDRPVNAGTTARLHLYVVDYTTYG